MTEVYDANARKKERLGDFLLRVGMDEFYKLAGMRTLAAPVLRSRARISFTTGNLKK